MATKPNASFSLADLDARSETPLKADYTLPNGKPSGIVFHILGTQSPAVTAETNKLLNDRRREEAYREVLKAKSRGRDEPDFTPVEDDIEFGYRLTAVKLVGWDGITEPYTPDLARELIRSNSDVADFITSKSGETANFMKACATT